mgnify:CR=1 FL=1
MTYCRETSLEETVAREASLVKRRLRTTRYERRTTLDQSRISVEEPVG